MNDQVTDERRLPFYTIEDAFLKRFGKLIGPNGIAVYSVLCMHANKKTHESWPSRETISELTGLSVRAISASLKKLSACGLITIEATKGGPNHYFIQSVPEEAPPLHLVQAPTLAPGARGIARRARGIAPHASPLAPGALEQESGTRIKNQNQEQEMAATADAAPPAPPVEASVKPVPAAKPDKPAPPPKPAPKTPTRRTATGQIQRTPEQHALCEELIDGLQEVTGMLRQTNRSALYTAGWTLVNLLDAGITPSKAHIVKAFGQTDPGPGQWWWYRDDQRVKIDVGKGRDAPMPKPLQVAEMYTVSLRPPLAVVDPPMGASNRKPRVIIGETLAEIRQRRAAQAAQEGRG